MPDSAQRKPPDVSRDKVGDDKRPLGASQLEVQLSVVDVKRLSAEYQRGQNHECVDHELFDCMMCGCRKLKRAKTQR